jgi:protein TonB
MTHDPHAERGSDSMFRLLASAPERRKGGSGAIVTSVALHAGIFAALVWATLAVGEEIAEEEEKVTFIEVAEEIIPPPPPPPPEPEAPPPPVMEDIPKGFQTLTTPDIVPPDIPPPGEKIEEADFSGEGVEGGLAEGVPSLPGGEGEGPATFTFTPYTVKPKCTSGCTADEILRHVPPLLQRSGVQCDLTVGIRIDIEGKVTTTDLLKSSGNSACDKAAEQWALTTKWTTAYNRDQAVTVWIAQPVTIQTK